MKEIQNKIVFMQTNNTTIALLTSPVSVSPSAEEVIRHTFGEEYFSSLNRKVGASRTDSLLGAYLLYALCERLSLLGEDLTVKRNCHGKPYFPFADGVFFSISHDARKNSDTLAILSALSLSGDTGADVMLLPPTQSRETQLDIAKRFMCECDYEKLIALGDDDIRRIEVFSSLWTAREAYSKLLGGKLSDALGVPIPENLALTTKTMDVDGVRICYSICKQK
jgi:phosphopantetheinyl transferase